MEDEYVFYGFTLGTFKSERKLSINRMQNHNFLFHLNFADEKLIRSYLKNRIKKICEQFIKKNETELSVEKARELRQFAETFTDAADPELNELIKDFNRIVDRYLTVPSNVPLYYDIYQKEKILPVAGSSQEREEHLKMLQKIYKQQKILQEMLKNELEFEKETLSREKEIDSELIELVGRFMQRPNTDHMNNVENFLRNYDLK